MWAKNSYIEIVCTNDDPATKNYGFSLADGAYITGSIRRERGTAVTFAGGLNVTKNGEWDWEPAVS